MVRRTKEEALETRDRILDTAEQVFSERGVARTSLADIADAAGVTRGAIYWHFKNKGDLFSAMLDRVALPMEAHEERQSNRADNRREAIESREQARQVLGETLHRNPEDPERARRRRIEGLSHRISGRTHHNQEAEDNSDDACNQECGKASIRCAAFPYKRKDGGANEQAEFKRRESLVEPTHEEGQHKCKREP